jgi:3-oxoacyl-[acyl-carrier-protein] synthase II
MNRRVVITGIGLVTPVGIGRDETWNAVVAGKSGIAPITLFNVTDFATKFAGEVKNWEPTRWLEKRDAKTYDRFLQFAVVAAQLAKDDSGLTVDEKNADRVGVYIGAGLGGVATIEKTHSAMLEKGPRRGISPYFVPMIIVNMAPGLVSIRFGAKGPNFSHVSACSTGAHSIGEAMRAIQRDDCDVMFAGGCEATITALGVGGFNAMRALSTRNEEPQRASRPFDLDRDGFVIAEGAGVLIVEELETAKKRGAHIYCELVGYGASSDAHSMVQPPDGGEGAQRCMKMALKDARMDPERVGYINAHGTSTKQGDIAETVAVKTVFGAHAKQLAMSSTKSMTGRDRGGLRGAGDRARHLATDGESGEARSGVRPRLRAQYGAAGALRRGAVQQLRLRRDQLDADLRPLQRRLMTIVVGSDHAGYKLKEYLKDRVAAWGHVVEDVGTHSTESCDYPVFGAAVGRRVVALGDGARGVAVCGSGVGVSIAANKVAGVRAALVQEPTAARLSRQHNDANVICFGERLIGQAVAEEALRVWLETPFEGGRHARRVALLEDDRR